MNELTITRNGKLLPFGYTVNFEKTQLPLMPEAIEVSETIAGSDGDVVFDTTYGARVFEIVSVTDDGLSPTEKENEKEKIRNFLHSIKKDTIKLKIEQSKRTYYVKYSGLGESNDLPMCVEFILPLKSSMAYAVSNDTYIHIGDGSFESNTIEPVGYKMTITGPASLPTIILNGETMSYNNTVVSGHKLVIDTNNNTVTDYNASNVGTNVMAYFNHNFPKIEQGTNNLSINSGITADNLKIEWNDLLL